jgi:alcohol dehydrogenase
MRAAVYEAFAEPLRVADLTDPEPARDGVVVEVRATGVCRSDWHAWMGHDPAVRLPHVPGHELAGVVAAAGPEVRGFESGDRVTVPFCCGCGRCEPCRHGHTQICDEDYQPGFTAWGSFAEYVAIPRADLNLVRLPGGLGFVDAASLGCRFMTAFAAIEVHGRVAPGDWVAVHGCGGVGLAAVMIAAARGAGVVAVDVDPGTLDLARSIGAAHAVDARTADPVAAVTELTGGGAHVSLDTLGSATTCDNSIRCLRKRGRHVQVGLLLEHERRVALPMDRVISYELELRGVHGMAVGHYDALLRAIAHGTLDPARLVTKTISLDEAGAELAAMTAFAQRGVTVITSLTREEA